MTTDAEVKAAFAHAFTYRHDMTDKEREDWLREHKSHEWFFQAHLETPGRRERLATSLTTQAQIRLPFVIAKRRRWLEGGYGLEALSDQMQRLWNALDGTEKVDRVRLSSLLSDLRATQAEYLAARAKV